MLSSSTRESPFASSFGCTHIYTSFITAWNCQHCHLTCDFPLSRLLIYGKYCSHMEYAQNTLNHLLANREDVRQKVEVSGQGAGGCLGRTCWSSGWALGNVGFTRGEEGRERVSVLPQRGL